MNSEYLGDALDHWKGSIIQRLVRERLLNNIAVIPMLTDGSWGSQTKKMSAYANLLNLEKDKILRTRKFGTNREKYFRGISHPDDLFLDPDTGVSISSSTDDRKHVNISQIQVLLNEHRNRLVLVYQHRIRYKYLKWCLDFENIMRNASGLHCLTYDCREAAMLFFSYKEDRLQKIGTCIKKDLLCRNKFKRINLC